MDALPSVPMWAEILGSIALIIVLVLIVLRTTNDDDDDLPSRGGPPSEGRSDRAYKSAIPADGDDETPDLAPAVRWEPAPRPVAGGADAEGPDWGGPEPSDDGPAEDESRDDADDDRDASQPAAAGSPRFDPPPARGFPPYPGEPDDPAEEAAGSEPDDGDAASEESEESERFGSKTWAAPPDDRPPPAPAPAPPDDWDRPRPMAAPPDDPPAASASEAASAGPDDDGDLPDLEPHEYRVWYGTNRQPVDEADPAKGFTGKRSKTVRHGHCDVYVPVSHRIGSIGSPWYLRVLRWEDDRLKLRRIAVLPGDDFWPAVRAQIEKSEPGRRHGVVFIHGYNVSFEEAAIRAAQIGKDLQVAGAMAFFSWPSKGTIEGYLADSASIEASEGAIAEFLVDFARHSGAEAVHVIAHSMGNRGVLRAVSRIAQNAEQRTGCRFDQFILAAPDVDADTFLGLAAAYSLLAKRTTLYVSSKDKAVELSRWLHDYPRVGFEPPISIFDGIDTVNVSAIDLTMLGHGYVGDARGVLKDMHELIFHGAPPDQRFALEERRSETGQRYWSVKA